MDLFDIVISGKIRKEGGGGGGDFSTAEVTFYTSNNSPYDVIIPQVDEEHAFISATSVHQVGAGGFTAKVPLYKGALLLDPMIAFAGLDPTFTGGISATSDGIIITGDGTFTADGHDK